MFCVREHLRNFYMCLQNGSDSLVLYLSLGEVSVNINCHDANSFKINILVRMTQTIFMFGKVQGLNINYYCMYRRGSQLRWAEHRHAGDQVEKKVLFYLKSLG